MDDNKNVSVSLTQYILFVWIVFSTSKGVFEGWLLNPHGIWLNSPLCIFDALFSLPSLLLFNTYALFFSFLPIGYGPGGWSLVPHLNTFGTVLVWFVVTLTFLIPAFFIGRYIDTKSWKKIASILFGFFLIFDVMSFTFGLVRGWQNAPVLQAQDAAIGKCNAKPVEVTKCLQECEKALPSLPVSGRTEKMVNDYNDAWESCSSRCTELSIRLKKECLKATGLPEYQDH